MIYSWIWKKLPGGKLSKLLFATAALFALISFLFGSVYPALDQWFVQNPTVGS